MKKPLWIIITAVTGFLGFMMGYSVPPFMEVGFGSSAHDGGTAVQQDQTDEELLQHYKDLYKQD